MSSEDSNGLKRRRVARACDTCRRKKVRCDGVQPGTDPPSCTNCKAYGYECAFIDAPKKRGPPKGYIEALETRLQRMESILGGLVQSGDLPEGTISSNLEWINVNESNFRSAQESNGSSSSRLRKSSSYDSSTLGNNLRNGKPNPSYTSKNVMTSSNPHSYKNGGQSSDSEECFSSDGNEYSGSQYDLNDSMGQLAIDESGHTRYLGNSSGIFLLKITKKVANGQIITIPKSDWHTPVKRIGASMVLELPPKELCDRLLDAYWREVHPFMPFIDKDDVMEKYEKLETNYPSIMLLYSIFAMSAKYIDDPSMRSDPNDISTSGYHYFAKAKELLKDEFDNATIPIVQSLLLLAVHHQGHKDSVTWVYIGLAIRLAQDLGLHRDSAKWNFDERQGEVRRRVWWACVMADRFASAGFGRPLAINEADWDVDYPVAGKIPGDEEESIEGWVQMIKCNLILGRIINHIYGIKSKSSQGNMESVLGTLDNELNEWRDSLPKKFLYDSTTMYLSDINVNRKVFLNLFYYTQQILLHRPHIRGPKSKAPPSSIPSLTICTMAANNITHILYRAMKDGALKLSWAYTVYPFFTAASMHIINALSGDDRFREVAKHGLRMSLKCLEFMSQSWFSTDKIAHIIRDLLKASKIELEGFTEASEASECGNLQAQQINTSSNKQSQNGFPRYVKLEDMASEGTPRDKNPFLNCLPTTEEQPPPKVTFASSQNRSSSPTTNSTNSFEQNQQNHQQHTTYTESIFTAFINQQNTINNSNPSSETNSPQSSTMRSPTNDTMQYEQTSSPESTTSSSSSPGFMSFTEYLTTDGGLFPTNADAFNPDVSSLIFENIDDPMGNNNPFLSLPSAIDWNGWTDWTEYMLRMQGLRNPNPNMTSVTGPPNIVVGNQSMQNAVTTLMGATNIPSNMG